MATDSKSLIIVESPSKIKTLKKFLWSEYVVEASVGHIRDLAKKDKGVDIDNDLSDLSVILQSSLDHGTVEINDLEMTYFPYPNLDNGFESIYFTVFDGELLCLLM